MTRCFRLFCSLFLFLIGSSTIARSQERDSTRFLLPVGGSVMVTNKGISTIPNFTLGKPAAVFTMVVGKKIRFEPEFRFALEGKPWMFIFWWRTELIKKEHFALRLGANPTLAYKSMTVEQNGASKTLLASYRTLTADLTPTYTLSKQLALGLYYMYVYGVEDITAQNTHYLAARAYFSAIRLSEKCGMKFTPQYYYLLQDGHAGSYLSATASLQKQGLPFTLSTLVSQPLQSNIPSGGKMVWNISLTYSFQHNWIRERAR
ncbi:MAG: hypothetical protein LWW85_08815 [Marinilabiliales bacterium]|nr:hypothetical protein [Marinilabiliales bacterium]